MFSICGKDSWEKHLMKARLAVFVVRFNNGNYFKKIQITYRAPEVDGEFVENIQSHMQQIYTFGADSNHTEKGGKSWSNCYRHASANRCLRYFMACDVVDKADRTDCNRPLKARVSTRSRRMIQSTRFSDRKRGKREIRDTASESRQSSPDKSSSNTGWPNHETTPADTRVSKR